jgi:hypothetical protein
MPIPERDADREVAAFEGRAAAGRAGLLAARATAGGLVVAVVRLGMVGPMADAGPAGIQVATAAMIARAAPDAPRARRRSTGG